MSVNSTGNTSIWTISEDTFEYRVAIGWIYFVILVVGFIGNIVIVIVTCSKPWRGNPLSVILIALALSDILILLSTPLTFFLRFVYDVEVVAQSEPLCKLVPFVVYAAKLTSAWLLVSAILERIMNVVVTRDSITRWTQRRLVSSVVVIATWVVCYSINAHLLAHWGLKGATETKHCSYSAISEYYAEFFNKQLPWFELFISFIIPYSIALFGSTVILRKSKIQQLHTRYGPNLTTLSMPRTTLRFSLMVLSITSIVTLGPKRIYRLYWTYDKSPTNDWFYDAFIYNLLAALAHTNAAMRFYLYVISDKEFRGALLSIFERKQRATTYTRIDQRPIPGNDLETFNNESRL